MQIKKYQTDNVLTASRKRISKIFDDFERIYCSFSGGKDSTVMLHLIMDEAIKRKRTVGVLIIDLEAQYKDTIKNIERITDLYKNNTDLYWTCVPLLLRNSLAQLIS
jgi:predicted phosphoadenosine phosphosulfate sulfurtransferase